MICVIQRVSESSVSVSGSIVGKSGPGLCIFLCAVSGDTDQDVSLLTEKIPKLRVFPDENGKNNLSLLDKNFSLLVVSNFTLAADCRKGNRPSYFAAGDPKRAEELYLLFVKKMEEKGIHTETGIFGEHMEVSLKNNGPVTLFLNSADLRKTDGKGVIAG